MNAPFQENNSSIQLPDEKCFVYHLTYPSDANKGPRMCSPQNLYPQMKTKTVGDCTKAKNFISASPSHDTFENFDDNLISFSLRKRLLQRQKQADDGKINCPNELTCHETIQGVHSKRNRRHSLALGKRTNTADTSTEKSSDIASISSQSALSSSICLKKPGRTTSGQGRLKSKKDIIVDFPPQAFSSKQIDIHSVLTKQQDWSA